MRQMQSALREFAYVVDGAEGEECIERGVEGYCSIDPGALNADFEVTRAGTCYHLDGLACLNGRCVPLPGEGDACSPNNEDSDDSSEACQSGLACREGRCVNAETLREGDACEFYTPDWCTNGLTCDNSGDGGMASVCPKPGLVKLASTTVALNSHT